MVVLNGGIALLMALNLAVNTAIGLMILINCPYFIRPLPIRWPDRLRDKPDLKATEKGEKNHEQSVD